MDELDGIAPADLRDGRSRAGRSVLLSSDWYGLSDVGRCGVTGSSWFQTSGGVGCGADTVPGQVAVYGEVAMHESWEALVMGPPDAARSVLLLPGGACAARSFNLVMAEPALSGVRLVATTLPGNAGAPVSRTVSIPALARRAGELAEDHDCDVVVGFSNGATVALDMVLSGHFHGPVVLLGISMTTADEARFFRVAVRASQKVGRWPLAVLIRLMPLIARSAKTDRVHKQELIEDFKQNRARDVLHVTRAYLDYIAANRDPAAELAASGNPAWVVHAEKGDGDLTEGERATLEAAPNVTVVTIPGSVFLLPDEVPQQIAEVIAAGPWRIPAER